MVSFTPFIMSVFRNQRRKKKMITVTLVGGPFHGEQLKFSAEDWPNWLKERGWPEEGGWFWGLIRDGALYAEETPHEKPQYAPPAELRLHHDTVTKQEDFA